MVKQKIKAILNFLFLIMPSIFFEGLMTIIVNHKEIISWQFIITKFKKPKIDKEKFDKMMRRIMK